MEITAVRFVHPVDLRSVEESTSDKHEVVIADPYSSCSRGSLGLAVDEHPHGVVIRPKKVKDNRWNENLSVFVPFTNIVYIKKREKAQSSLGGAP